MKILDKNDVIILSPDYDKGYLVDDRHFVKHHEAIEGVAEVGHYETVMEYDNGGKDVKWVVDTPGVAAEAAWDEYEDILRYIEYPPEKLSEVMRKKRTSLLRHCDWTQTLDAPIDATTRDSYRVYRQALRDITEQAGFPQEIVWPELPAIVKAAPDPVDDAVDVLIGGTTNA